MLPAAPPAYCPRISSQTLSSSFVSAPSLYPILGPVGRVDPHVFIRQVTAPAYCMAVADVQVNRDRNCVRLQIFQRRILVKTDRARLFHDYDIADANIDG